MVELEGKVVLVTGGGNGIGRESALALARAGASVLVNDVGSNIQGVGSSVGPAQQVAEEIQAFGGRAAHNCDSVVSLDAVRGMVEQARDLFGGLHAIVHPAGINRPAPLREMGEEDWNLVIDTHLRSAFNVARASLQLFLDQNDGAYVFFTSTAGIYGEELLANYAAAKSGVIAINKVLTLETAGTAIRTNVIAPHAWTRMLELYSEQTGATAESTAMLRDRMRADQVATLVVALCSPRTKATGQVFGARGNEVMVFSEPLSARSIADSNGWTPEALVEQGLPALAPGFTSVTPSSARHLYPPI